MTFLVILKLKGFLSAANCANAACNSANISYKSLTFFIKFRLKSKLHILFKRISKNTNRSTKYSQKNYIIILFCIL